MKVCKMLPILKRGKESLFSYKREESTIGDFSTKKSKDVWIEKIILDGNKKNGLLDIEKESLELTSLKESFEKLSSEVKKMLSKLDDDLPYFMNTECSINPSITCNNDYINLSLTIVNILPDEKYILYPFGKKYINKNYFYKELLLTASNSLGQTTTINGTLSIKYERCVIILSEVDMNSISLPFEIRYSGNLAD